MPRSVRESIATSVPKLRSVPILAAALAASLVQGTRAEAQDLLSQNPSAMAIQPDTNARTEDGNTLHRRPYFPYEHIEQGVRELHESALMYLLLSKTSPGQIQSHASAFFVEFGPEYELFDPSLRPIITCEHPPSEYRRQTGTNERLYPRLVRNDGMVLTPVSFDESSLWVTIPDADVRVYFVRADESNGMPSVPIRDFQRHPVHPGEPVLLAHSPNQYNTLGRVDMRSQILPTLPNVQPPGIAATHIEEILNGKTGGDTQYPGEQFRTELHLEPGASGSAAATYDPERGRWVAIGVHSQIVGELSLTRQGFTEEDFVRNAGLDRDAGISSLSGVVPELLRRGILRRIK